MKPRPPAHFLRPATVRLAASYLAIIMVLSVGFSYVLYRTSAHELERQIPPSSLFIPSQTDFGESLEYHSFWQQRVAEGRGHLLDRLIILNFSVLVIGAALSYYLARRTLRPIEEAMEAQSRFVTDASHELRTPLTAILAGNEVALRKPRLTLNQAKQLIASNVEEMGKLKSLSDGLLDLSKQDSNSLAKQPVSLQDVAGEAMNRVLTAAQAKQISIQDDVPAVKVLGNMPSLAQAAAVLLDNAIKYSPAKSTIYLSGKVEDGYGHLSVRDEGVGIMPKNLPHIFERFYRINPARTADGTDGHGIGLSIAQKIVEHHHGKITVNSQPRQGSIFTIQLPLA
jgi:two-component system sensor histidine kinase CiaH